MYCEPTNHNFHVVSHGIKCKKCKSKKVFSNFGFDQGTTFIFTELSCWLLAILLKDKLNAEICFYRDYNNNIYHVAVLYNDNIIDITGIHSIESFENMCENYISFTKGINGYFSIASVEDIRILFHYKIGENNRIEDKWSYSLANECANKIISIIRKKRF